MGGLHSRIGDGVIQIDTLLGGWTRATAGYLIEGPAPVLVETGSQTSVPGVLAALDEAGLVLRSADPDDARCVNITLSPAGREHVERMRAQGIAYLNARVARLDDAQRASLAAALPALEALVEDEYQA